MGGFASAKAVIAQYGSFHIDLGRTRSKLEAVARWGYSLKKCMMRVIWSE